MSKSCACLTSEILASGSSKETRVSWSKWSKLFFKPFQLGITLADELVEIRNILFVFNRILFSFIRESVFENLLCLLLPCAYLRCMDFMLGTDLCSGSTSGECIEDDSGLLVRGECFFHGLGG